MYSDKTRYGCTQTILVWKNDDLTEAEPRQKARLGGHIREPLSMFLWFRCTAYYVGKYGGFFTSVQFETIIIYDQQ